MSQMKVMSTTRFRAHQASTPGVADTELEKKAISSGVMSAV